MSQKPCKGRGVCAVCWLSFKTHASDGSIHRHGHRSEPCLGSNQPPAEGPIKATAASQSSSATSSLISSSLGLSSDEASFSPRLSHPVSPGLLIKRIPKSARPSCAALLADIIQDVVMEPDCVEKWSNLLSFGGTVLVKPRRGGRKHNTTKISLARITDWRLKGPSHSMKAELESTSNRKPRVNKYDHDKFLASIVASKLEEGDFKPAICISICYQLSAIRYQLSAICYQLSYLQ